MILDSFGCPFFVYGYIVVSQKRNYGMGVQNEIVRFVAEIDLDPQDAAKFKAALKDAENSAAGLRRAISDVGNEMTKMRAEGKESSAEYKKLEDQQKNYVKALKTTTKEMNSYASALGVNKMSMNQLRGHAQKLKNALNEMSKEVNPELWNKYNKELISTENRIKEVTAGTKGMQGPLNTVKNFFGDIKSPQTWGLIVSGIFKLGQSLLNKFAETTQIVGDKVGIATAAMKAGWDHLFRSITAGNSDMVASMREVIEASIEAQRIRDELFEKENSLQIAEAKARSEIAKQNAIVNNSSYSPE